VLSVRMGVAGALVTKVRGETVAPEGLTPPVAKVIKFYIPTKFPKRVKWLPPQQRGKVIEFSLKTKRSA
jgi:hypothetical protein